jgi:hypothetical protein
MTLVSSNISPPLISAYIISIILTPTLRVGDNERAIGDEIFLRLVLPDTLGIVNAEIII